MSKSIRPEELSTAIISALTAYKQEVTDQIKEDVKQVAKECVKEIKRESPIDTGGYKKGWKSKVEDESDDEIRVTVYNSKKTSLTHLAEFGHAKVNGGGRVEGKPHIYPAQEHAAEKLVEKAKAAVKRR